GNIYVNLFAGLDIGYSLAEDVRPFFGQQRGDIVLLVGLLIKPLSLFAFTNDAADSALTHGHDEAIYRSVVRQRKHIDSFNFTAIRVQKLLADLHRADVTAN